MCWINVCALAYTKILLLFVAKSPVWDVAHTAESACDDVCSKMWSLNISKMLKVNIIKSQDMELLNVYVMMHKDVVASV